MDETGKKTGRESPPSDEHVQPDRRKLIKRMAKVAVAVPVVTVLHDAGRQAKAGTIPAS